MFRSCLNIVLTSKLAHVQPVQHQILRWKRKPRKPFWLGTAKTKKFKIHEQPVLPPEEAKELLRLHADYKSAMKSVRHYIMTSGTTQLDTAVANFQLATEEEIEESIKRNNEWNARCAAVRAERLAKEDAEHEETVLRVLDEAENRKKSLMERVEELVLIEKEQSQNFVTMENLDEKIEECLAKTVDHNFAIDLEGNRYTGFGDELKITSPTGEVIELENQQKKRQGQTQ